MGPVLSRAHREAGRFLWLRGAEQDQKTAQPRPAILPKEVLSPLPAAGLLAAIFS